MARVKVTVGPIRDPDTLRVLGWIIECPQCRGYTVTDEHADAMSAGRWHPCTWPRPRIVPWRPR